MQIPYTCLVCKGRDCKKYCGDENCPTCKRFKAIFQTKQLMEKEEFSGFSPTPFVGRFNYPNINVGIMSSPEEAYGRDYYDNPRGWSAEGFDMMKLIDIRSSLVNSNFQSNVHSARNQERLLELSQEIGLARKPVDVEIHLKQKPRFNMEFSSTAAPHGPTGKLEDAEITSNPNADNRLEKVTDDTDLKAVNAMTYLYQHGIDENRISRALSIGLLGTKPARKLTPTRWSITATDDSLGKNLISQIRDSQQAGPEFLFGGFLGNYYLIMLFPGVWGYELFEMYVPDSKRQLRYTTDHETYRGRKDYANDTAGGYYTVRLAIAEKLHEMKRQATVLALRFITDEYVAPLGVWVTREAARKSVSAKPTKFSSDDMMVEFAKAFVQKKFGIRLDNLFKKSVLYRSLKTQTKLSAF